MALLARAAVFGPRVERSKVNYTGLWRVGVGRRLGRVMAVSVPGCAGLASHGSGGASAGPPPQIEGVPAEIAHVLGGKPLRRKDVMTVVQLYALKMDTKLAAAQAAAARAERDAVAAQAAAARAERDAVAAQAAAAREAAVAARWFYDHKLLLGQMKTARVELLKARGLLWLRAAIETFQEEEVLPALNRPPRTRLTPEIWEEFLDARPELRARIERQTSWKRQGKAAGSEIARVYYTALSGRGPGYSLDFQRGSEAVTISQSLLTEEECLGVAALLHEFVRWEFDPASLQVVYDRNERARGAGGKKTGGL